MSALLLTTRRLKTCTTFCTSIAWACRGANYKNMARLLFVLNILSRGLARLQRRAVVKDTRIDLRSLGPIHVCSCGSRLFKVGCMFEDNDISMWFVNAECAECDALVKIPTPADVVS